MPLNILVIGAGVCGPAFVALLRRADPELKAYEITVIERAAKLREGGLQIDLRAQGISVVRKMGLLDAIRSRVVPEKGVTFVDTRGRTFASFGKNDSGHGAQGMTSEYEIMRGDLVDVFYRSSLGLSLDDTTRNGEKESQKVDEAQTNKGSEIPTASRSPSNGNVHYEFGITVTDLVQPPSGSSGPVTATFSDGRQARYDLVVGADGQGSRTRRMVLGTAASDACFRSLDLFATLYLIPRDAASDDGWMHWHVMGGRRAVFTRAADEAAPTQVYMAVQTSRAENAHGVPAAMRQSVAEQKAAFTRAFAGQQQQKQQNSSNRVDSLAKALETISEDDFYATEIGQVRCDTLVVGRVVLLGDAGYCPSPITGMGTTLSLTGAYILAGELARHGAGDVTAALKAYERGVRPFVTQAQKLVPGAPRMLYPESNWGVWVLSTIIWLVAKLRLLDLLVRLMPQDTGGLSIPEYPELNLGS
ncbi:FAD/NAD(P)-binding domain-containing protein [Nemania abortiva]|nr:FAD/NAD(P)-binding domain-containing protein [Nemania abortiva]